MDQLVIDPVNQLMGQILSLLMSNSWWPMDQLIQPPVQHWGLLYHFIRSTICRGRGVAYDQSCFQYFVRSRSSLPHVLFVYTIPPHMNNNFLLFFHFTEYLLRTYCSPAYGMDTYWELIAFILMVLISMLSWCLFRAKVFSLFLFVLLPTYCIYLHFFAFIFTFFNHISKTKVHQCEIQRKYF